MRIFDRTQLAPKCTVPYHTVTYHTVPYHTVTYRIIPNLPMLPLHQTFHEPALVGGCAIVMYTSRVQYSTLVGFSMV